MFAVTHPYAFEPAGASVLKNISPTRQVANPRMVQGAIEDSNVQPTAELVRMMSTEREFQFATQFVEAEGQRQQTAIDKIAGPVS